MEENQRSTKILTCSNLMASILKCININIYIGNDIEVQERHKFEWEQSSSISTFISRNHQHS